LRRLVFAVACVFVYVLLDRTTVYLQIWPSISAWYLPVGLSVAAWSKKRGFTVSIAVDGKQAIAATQNAEFDLILMDIQMPEMDGFEATAEIRKREKLTGRRTPIIALTAHALKDDRERCLSAGMDAYVTKPICPVELFQVIQTVLQSSSAGDASTLLTPVPSAS
jgi:CheY-like chemotaxis protein